MEDFMENFPVTRLRRNRQHHWLREMVAEHQLSVNDLIWPIFVQEGQNKRDAIASMPGVFRLSIDFACQEVAKAASLGIKAIAIFPVIDQHLKNDFADEALNRNNLMCRAVRAIKATVGTIGIIGDAALDPYTSHGQDGVMHEGAVVNDETVAIIARQAVLQAQAGCDIIAPSDMMDGRVGAIRSALDDAGLAHVAILSYAAKYASSFYGPFRDALGSAVNLGKADKRSYQMDPANSDEALREVALDIKEGADMVMVKPGLPYLDIVRRVKERFTIPVFAYQVSGEYAMIKAAAANGWIDGDAVMMETLLAFKRAGASAILTYAALEVATLLEKK
jgi:porphobilinogen synthase